MNRAGFKKVLVVVVAIVGLGFCAMPASACWGCHHGCCGGWHGSYCGCGWSGCGYGWGGYGCGGCAYGCGCGYGSGYGWSGYTDGSSCCGTSAAYSGISPATYASTGTLGGALASGASSASPDSEAVILTVSVPEDAKVTINGALTKSTGGQRRFVSYNLRPGLTYSYTVKAEIVRDGKIVPEEQTVVLTGGTQRSMAFEFNAPSDERLASTK